MMRKILIAALIALLPGPCTQHAFANFTVRAEQEEGAEQGWVVRYKVEACGAVFVLNPPPRWISEKNTAQSQITFRSEALKSNLSVRFVTNMTARTERELTAVVQERWPGAEIDASGIQHARDRSGRAVEFRWRATTGELYRTRLAVLDYSQAAVEIALTSPESDFGRGHAVWTHVLNSFGLDATK